MRPFEIPYEEKNFVLYMPFINGSKIANGNPITFAQYAYLTLYSCYLLERTHGEKLVIDLW